MKFTKRILEVGRYESPDGEVVVTPERLQHWSDTFRSMRKKKLGIPIGWDHHDDPNLSKPIQLGPGKRKAAKDVVGYVQDFQVGDDGQTAELTIDVPRDEDADKVKHNLAYVSPVIFDQWKDGRGEVHKDCITRVDLVQHPVDNSQTPFEAVACSLRMGLDTGKPETFRLAEMPEESEGSNTVDVDRLKSVIAALASMNVVLPADTTAMNFFERVEAALLTAAAMGGGESDDLEEAEQEQFAALSSQRGSAALSSQRDSTALSTERAENETSEESTDSLEGEGMSELESKLLNHANTQHREGVVRRLSVLLENGQCTPAEHKDKAEAAGAVRLSLNDEGVHEGSPLESWIESREAVPKGTFWSSEQRTQLATEVPHPEGIEGELSDEDADKVVDEILGKK